MRGVKPCVTPAGLGGGTVIAAPPGALNLLMQPGLPGPSSSAFQCVQHQPRPVHTGLSAQDELVLVADM